MAVYEGANPVLEDGYVYFPTDTVGVYLVNDPSAMAKLQTMLINSTGGKSKFSADALSETPTTSSLGSGARTVTITVNDGSSPIQNATVRMTQGVISYVGKTNVSGVVVFNLDDATWTVAITAGGYTFSGSSLVVSTDTSATYSMTATVVPLPPLLRFVLYGLSYSRLMDKLQFKTLRSTQG